MKYNPSEVDVCQRCFGLGTNPKYVGIDYERVSAYNDVPCEFCQGNGWVPRVDPVRRIAEQRVRKRFGYANEAEIYIEMGKIKFRNLIGG